MKVDILNTKNKYQIIYAGPPWLYNDTLDRKYKPCAKKDFEQMKMEMPK